MDRRNFLRKAGIMSAALTSATSTRGGLKRQAQAARVEPRGAVTLSNDALVWRLEWRKRRLGSSRFENKLSGRAFPLSFAQEIVLTFSASKHRVEIPWWRFAFGPDKTSVPPAQEQGFRLGYDLPDFSDRGWGATENLLLRSLRGVKRHDDGITYDVPGKRAVIDEVLHSPPEQAGRILGDHGVRYLFYGPRERTDGTLTEGPGLQRIYQSGDVEIYRAGA